LVGIGHGVELPHVGAAALAGDGARAAAEDVDLPVVAGLRLVMHRDGDVLLLRPLVRPGVVLVDERGRTAETRSLAHAWRRRLDAGRREAEASDHVELPVEDGAVQLLFGL